MTEETTCKHKKVCLVSLHVGKQKIVMSGANSLLCGVTVEICVRMSFVCYITSLGNNM